MIKKLLKFLSFGLFISWALFVSASVTMAATYTYDTNGNLTSDGTMCYTYNDANKLSVVQNCTNSKLVAEYTYDAEGARIMKKIYDANGSLFKTVYSPSKFFEQVKIASNGATLNTSYYYSNDELVAKKNPDGTKNFFLNDHLNSTTVITDQAGQVVERTTYNPYGEITSGGTQSKYQYTGQEHDPETTLDYYQARYYSPHLKHFTQPDTIIPDIYNPQMLNRYSYVGNNPVTYNDPTGHCGPFTPLCVGAILAAPLIQAAMPVVIAQVQQAFTNYQENPTPLQAGLSTLDAMSVLPLPIGQVSKVAGVAKAAGISEKTGTIYRAFDESLNVEYIGKTVNFARREAEHLRMGRVVNKVQGLDNLPVPLLRPVEQSLIEHHGLNNLSNKINSISSKNPIYKSAVKVGSAYLKKVGYK